MAHVSGKVLVVFVLRDSRITRSFPDLPDADRALKDLGYERRRKSRRKDLGKVIASWRRRRNTGAQLSIEPD